MLLLQDMEPDQDGDKWMEDQWEKWLTHDFSLDEFEDEDLSEVTEITDECGGSLSCDDLDCKDHVTCTTNRRTGRAERRRGEQQDLGLLQLDLIDAEDEIEEEEEEQDWGLLRAAHPRLDHQQKEGEEEEEEKEEEDTAAIRLPPIRLAPTERNSAPVTMDTHRPKRPTTLALFPQVPRTQDTINNNSFGKKDTWKESNSSSPHITGDLTPTQDSVQQIEEGEVQHSGKTATKQRGTVPASLHSRLSRDNTHARAVAAGTNPRSTAADTQTGLRDQSSTARQRPTQRTQRRAAGAGMREGVVEGVRGRGASLEDQHPQPTEEIYLTPVQKDPDRPSLDRMSISSDTEGPPHPHPSLPDRTNPSISEEEEEVCPPVRPQGGTSSSGCLTAPKGRQDCTKPGQEGGPVRTVQSSSCEASAGLSYDSVKYTLVVDEHAKLELVSLKQCYQSYSDAGEDSDAETVYESANEDEDVDYEEDCRRTQMKRDSSTSTSSRLSKVPSSSESSGAPRSRKFLNVLVNGHHRRTGAESFGLFSCVLDGVERQQSHRAVFRFVPRHEDELELEVDDPLLMEVQAEDLWCQAYNMRTGTTGIFPAFYAVKVNQEHLKAGSSDGVIDRFRVRFLGSVLVPYHKGNDVLCAAMQKIAANRRMSMQPPSACVVEISLKGVKIIVQDECRTSERGDKCFHFFQLKNISFCGCHPKHNKYFGFITKHPDHQKFACHVVMSEDSSMPLAESVGRAFQNYYKEHMGYSCPTEDIFLE